MKSIQKKYFPTLSQPSFPGIVQEISLNYRKLYLNRYLNKKYRKDEISSGNFLGEIFKQLNQNGGVRSVHIDTNYNFINSRIVFDRVVKKKKIEF